jgi:hypothetical protein
MEAVMSLDFDVRKMRNFEVLTSMPQVDTKGEWKEDGERWHHITEALVFATMAIGIGSITATNWIEFYQRLHAVELVSGPYLRRHKDRYHEANYITPLEVYMHIGLHTNASSLSLAKFREHLYHLSCRETDYRVFDDVPNEYNALGLSEITKEEYWAAQKVKDLDDNFPLEQMIRKYRATQVEEEMVAEK